MSKSRRSDQMRRHMGEATRIMREKRAALGKAMGNTMKGRKRPTAEDKAEIANYIKNNPKPFGED